MYLLQYDSYNSIYLLPFINFSTNIMFQDSVHDGGSGAMISLFKLLLQSCTSSVSEQQNSFFFTFFLLVYIFSYT